MHSVSVQFKSNPQRKGVRKGHIRLVFGGAENKLCVVEGLFRAGQGSLMQHPVDEITDGGFVHRKDILPALKFKFCAGNAIGGQQHGHAPEIGIEIGKVIQRIWGSQGTHFQFRLGQGNQIGAPFRADFRFVAKG